MENNDRCANVVGNAGDRRGSGVDLVEAHLRTRLADACRAGNRHTDGVGGASHRRDRRIELGDRGVEDLRHGERITEDRLVPRTIGQRDAVAEIRRQLQLHEALGEVHLTDARSGRRLPLFEAGDGLRGRGANAIQAIQHPGDLGVVLLDAALVGFIVLHEGRAGSPLVGEESAEEPGALTAGGGGGEPRDGANGQSARALDRPSVARGSEVRIGRLEQRIGDAAARGSGGKREGRRGPQEAPAEGRVMHVRSPLVGVSG
ncbi:MAG: hypothetical protein IPP20_16090 [Gemmatimonadetes bacterium]|nr:hypothetical protein [Gemmatimonadota bacterium]